jgi:Na+/proline symporter
MDNKQKKRSTIGGFVFVGCMFIGIGLGMYFREVTTGTMLGMGVGFLGLALAWLLIKKE